MNCNNIPDSPSASLPHKHFFSGRGCAWIFGAFLLCSGLLVLSISFLILSASIDRFVNFIESDNEEETALTKFSTNKVVKITIEGTIAFEKDKDKSFYSAEDIIDDIRRAKEDKGVRGLLMVVNSPGGEITACDFIDQEIQKFRSSLSNRYVVTYMQGTAASGGYYISSHSDKIVITPTTITGSIGVMMEGFNFQEAAEKLGVKSISFTSGPMKDMLNPMKGVSEAVSNVVQGTINELYDQFVNVIVDGRHMPEEKVRKLADGRIYTAKQSLANGLTDKIGYMEAVKETFKELGLSNYELVEYEKDEDMVDMLKKAFSTFGGLKPEIKLPESSWRLRYASPFMKE